MSESSARIGIYADDKASPVVKTVQGSLQGLASQAKSSILTGIGLGAGVTAFNLIGRAAHEAVGFIEDSVRAAAAEQSSMAALTAALKANVAGYDGNNAAIEKVIQSRLRLGFTDDEQRAQLAALVAMTKDSTAALQIEGIAMDAAAITGKDFGSINIALGKAFEGNTAALKKLGIVVDKGTTGYALLDAVQRRFAGGAEAAANTTAGAAKGMAAEFDQLKEDIGNLLLPILADLAKTMRDKIIPALRDALPTIVSVGGVVLHLAQAAIPLLVLWIGTKLVAAFAAMRVAATGVLGPLGLIITAGLALGQSMQSSVYYGLKQQIALKEGAAAAKVFGDAMDATGNDVQKSLTAMHLSFYGTFSDIPVIVDRGLEKSRQGLVSGTNAISDAAYEAFDPIAWQAAQTAKVAAETAAKIPKMMGDAMVANDQALIDSTKVLANAISDSLTPAEQEASAIGFLTGDMYAAGLASGKPAAVAVAQELANKALVVLHGAAADGMAAGSELGHAWLDGLNAALKAGYSGQTYTWIQKYEKLLKMAGSPDYTHAIEAGVGVGKGWLSGVNKTLAGGNLNLPSLSGTTSGGGMGTSGGVAGREVHIHFEGPVYGDGPFLDQLAAKITQRLRFAPGT